MATTARTAALAATSASSSPPSAGSTKLTLHGGVPHHPSLAGLWRDERLTDFAVSAEGVKFKAHRVALASSSKYFLNTVEVYDPASDSWAQVSRLTSARNAPVAVAL